ncbi:MAG: SURF1 family protein, partial [Alphaproteobacteria bacterium]
ATLTAGLGVAILLGLGTWQVERASWKDGLQAALDARLALPPMALPQALDDPRAWSYRRVVVSGRFDHDHEMTVLAPSRDGVSGWHVVTPLVQADGTAVLVDRGWVPMGLRDAAARPAGQIAGPVTVEGVVVVPSEPGLFTPDNEPATGSWFRTDPAAMAAWAGVVAPPVLIEAGPRPVAGGFPEGGQTIVRLRNEHRGYAATWYALAVALAVVYVLYLRRERRNVPR